MVSHPRQAVSCLYVNDQELSCNSSVLFYVPNLRFDEISVLRVDVLSILAIIVSSASPEEPSPTLPSPECATMVGDNWGSWVGVPLVSPT